MSDYKITAPFDPRDYQMSIAKKASQQNTLVVLPTGMGKTLIGVMIGIERLNRHPESKILITAPTRPLNSQHTKSFEQLTNVSKEDIILVTGRSRPETRKKLYGEAKIIAATPQCIRNDLKTGILDMSDFSFVIFDEAHRAVKNYPYTTIAKKYMLQAQNPLILALTASPGGSREKITEITENLFIQAFDVRSEFDDDVKPYMKEMKFDWINVQFPEKYQRIKTLLKQVLDDDIQWLYKKRYLFTDRPSKKMLLDVQRRVSASYGNKRNKNFGAFWAMIRSAEAIKIEHAIELLETQGVASLWEYMKKLEMSKKRTDSRLMKNRYVFEAMKLIEEMNETEDEHPKMKKLRDMIKDIMKPNGKVKEDLKVIIFANYRSTVTRIKNLVEAEGISASEFIGQTTKEGKGMKQDDQIETLDLFRQGEFNVLVATSVGEEGLDVPSVDYAIFYEPVPSEIRNIQRRGRVARQTSGKVIFLITKGTRDEVYYYAALNKEKKMKGILYDLKNGKKLQRKKSLLDYSKR
ncbi:MAG: DEAD/DEAH box helicase [Kosmotogaceae bacterium]|nr:DEAD/DEAH box helicase [Kosmotogaceae bacterium]